MAPRAHLIRLGQTHLPQREQGLLMSEFVFDLSEVFSASTGKLRFYGIMRVVEQIGIQLVRQNAPVRYAMFSYAHQGFLEVSPRLTQTVMLIWMYPWAFESCACAHRIGANPRCPRPGHG